MQWGTTTTAASILSTAWGQDNILVLDAMDLRTPLTQFSVGNGANPHDIEIVAPDKAYVTRYDDDIFADRQSPRRRGIGRD